jgi:hypothetical protein
MGVLEGSGVPVLYIGRTVPKRYVTKSILQILNIWLTLHLGIPAVEHEGHFKIYDSSYCVSSRSSKTVTFLMSYNMLWMFPMSMGCHTSNVRELGLLIQS